MSFDTTTDGPTECVTCEETVLPIDGRCPMCGNEVNVKSFTLVSTGDGWERVP